MDRYDFIFMFILVVLIAGQSVLYFHFIKKDKELQKQIDKSEAEIKYYKSIIYKDGL